MTINIGNRYSEKQEAFLKAKRKYIAFGGARGGGKSWAVRCKAKLLALRYAGIRILIVRRTYPELYNNHINILRKETLGIAKYVDVKKELTFINGSLIQFSYCAKDSDVDRMQGVEYDIIFFDEATQLSEYQMKTLSACLRGTNNFPKRIYYTCNPGGQGHGYIKRLFIDRKFEEGENPEEYEFIQSLVTDNTVLMETDADYLKQLDALPEKLKKAWRYGDWNVFEGQFFEDFIDDPKGYESRQFSHVIEPFVPPIDWKIYRSYDFGYNKPFSCGWWAVDYDGIIYRIAELYGCTKDPNTGVKWNPNKQFEEIARMEHEHPYLKGRDIHGVADPSIWDASRGESVADTAMKHGIFFVPGDNERIPGWMQIHYRFVFDSNGHAMMYIFNTCKAFIRTMPLLTYSETHIEDLDTSLEDHVADETRYFCMSRPITPRTAESYRELRDDPLNMGVNLKKYRLKRVDDEKEDY